MFNLTNRLSNRAFTSAFGIAGAVALAGTAASASSATLTAELAVDNIFSAFVSDDLTTPGDLFLFGDNWLDVETASYEITEPGTHFLHIHAIDWGRPAAFIGEFELSGDATFSNGSQSLTTADMTEWTASLWGPGLNDMAVIDLGANGTLPWIDFEHFDDARFIWIEGEPADMDVWFTTAITVVPTPGALALLGGAGLVATRRRR